MAATTTGTKTVTNAVAPHLSAAVLTALLATPIELMTVDQIHQIVDALNRVPHGDAPGRVIGNLFT
jgi:hypothetical protein